MIRLFVVCDWADGIIKSVLFEAVHRGVLYKKTVGKFYNTFIITCNFTADCLNDWRWTAFCRSWLTRYLTDASINTNVKMVIRRLQAVTDNGDIDNSS